MTEEQERQINEVTVTTDAFLAALVYRGIDKETVLAAAHGVIAAKVVRLFGAKATADELRKIADRIETNPIATHPLARMATAGRA